MRSAASSRKEGSRTSFDTTGLPVFCQPTRRPVRMPRRRPLITAVTSCSAACSSSGVTRERRPGIFLLLRSAVLPCNLVDGGALVQLDVNAFSMCSASGTSPRRQEHVGSLQEVPLALDSCRRSDCASADLDGNDGGCVEAEGELCVECQVMVQHVQAPVAQQAVDLLVKDDARKGVCHALRQPKPMRTEHAVHGLSGLHVCDRR